jgi:hypothetical protein
MPNSFATILSSTLGIQEIMPGSTAADIGAMTFIWLAILFGWAGIQPQICAIDADMEFLLQAGRWICRLEEKPDTCRTRDAACIQHSVEGNY